MITIKTMPDDHGRAELVIKKGTPHTTMLLGVEMLIEALMKEPFCCETIDDLLADLKRIYLRDNGDNNGS